MRSGMGDNVGFRASREKRVADAVCGLLGGWGGIKNAPHHQSHNEDMAWTHRRLHVRLGRRTVVANRKLSTPFFHKDTYTD